MSRKNRRILILSGLMLLLTLSACTAGTAPVPTPTPPLSFMSPEPTLQPSDTGPAEGATLAPTPQVEGYWIQPGIPAHLADALAPALNEAGLVALTIPDEAILKVVINPGPDAALTAEWVYALAAPFATVPDDVSWAALVTYWQTGDSSGLPGFELVPQFVLTPDEATLLTELLGPPSPATPVQTASPYNLTDYAWNIRPTLSLLPFDTLTPRWKVLSIDGLTPLDRALPIDTYPLRATFGIEAATDRASQIAAGLEVRGLWAATNRDTSKMTVVVMTGVTALARATASMMEVRGIDFPAQHILDFIADADIMHTSNEVSFTPLCPPPEWEGDTTFCSDPDHFQLLQTIGLDVVELTGNHVNDWGTNALLYTLDLYEANSIVYYGGGRDLADANTPRIVTAPDGTRIGFVGCNPAGPWIAFAGEENAGSAPCDDWQTITANIRTLKESGQADLVIATVQYWERQRYEPTEQQVIDFDLLAAAGADIVSGSQAHQPQGFGFTGDTFIHYGVGNLFFDQMQALGYRQMFIDKHILYEGRHISTILFTGLMEDYSQPNPMTPEDRAAFLQLIFTESGW